MVKPRPQFSRHFGIVTVFLLGSVVISFAQKLPSPTPVWSVGPLAKGFRRKRRDILGAASRFPDWFDFLSDSLHCLRGRPDRLGVEDRNGLRVKRFTLIMSQKSAKGVLLQKSGGRPERKGVASKSRDLRSDQRQKSQPCWPSGRQQE